MFAPILITGGSIKERQKKADDIIGKYLDIKDTKILQNFLKSPDYVCLDKINASIGIEEIRNIEYQIFLKPYAHEYKSVFINESDLMTSSAQNAFLKTLEEPPAYCLIILGATNVSSLLPTVISRCRIIAMKNDPAVNLNPEEVKEYEESIGIIISQNIGEKFILAEKWSAQKKDIQSILNNMCLILRSKITDLYSNGRNDLNKQLLNKYLILLKNTLITGKYLEANVNPRFALENLFLAC